MQAADAAVSEALSPAASRSDPLALDPHWPSAVPLLGFQAALEESVFRSGLSREAWLRRLAGQLQRPALLPLLWLLPRGWRLAPAQLPAHLHNLAAVVEEGLLSPALLAALVDDLPHLLPPGQGAQLSSATNALSLWSRSGLQEEGQEQPLPADRVALAQLLERIDAPSDPTGDINGTERNGQESDPPTRRLEGLSGALIWQNRGLSYGQNASNRRANSLLAQVLNRLAANQLEPGDSWCFEQARSGRSWLQWLQQQGWQLQARLRCSVASFGLGACLPDEQGGNVQVPLGLPLRTGLLTSPGGTGLESEALALLPHSALELELQTPAGQRLLLQYYQGTEGLCGWAGLNDLHRPWQNDRENGTVRYLGEPFSGESLLNLIDLCELMALVHNRAACRLGLRCGGYGSLGFCIDSTALLEQAMCGRSSLFPLLLSGIWRERLLAEAERIERSAMHRSPEALERYRQAVEQLPLDLSHHGGSRADAWRRLQACQPLSSPFQLVQRRRNGEDHGP